MTYTCLFNFITRQEVYTSLGSFNFTTREEVYTSLE